MHSYLRQNKAWSQREQERDPAFFKALQDLQSPAVMWIGCAETRVPVSAKRCCSCKLVSCGRIVGRLPYPRTEVSRYQIAHRCWGMLATSERLVSCSLPTLPLPTITFSWLHMRSYDPDPAYLGACGNVFVRVPGNTVRFLFTSFPASCWLDQLLGV